MRKLYFFFAAITIAATAKSQVFFDDFEDGNLEGYTLYNLDGFEPDDPDLATMEDSAWTVRAISAQGWEYNLSAFSVSWYVDDVGPSDDWLITPPITIGEAAVLEWDAMAITSSGDFRDRYEVFISNSPDLSELGLLAPAFTMGDTGEVDFPVHRVLNLSTMGYANETIYVAFRNNTQGFDPELPIGPGNGGNELAIDNIQVTDATVGLEEASAVEHLRVIPNPSTAGQNFELLFTLKESLPVIIEVIDITGKIQKIKNVGTLPSGGNRVVIENNSLAEGLYFIRMRTGNQSSVIKAVIH